MRKTVLAMLVCVAGGCVPTLKDVRTELREGGFALWYPAESGVEPGQIWVTNGTEKHIRQRRPDQLALFGPNPTQFKTLSKTVDADLSLDVSFGEGVLGKAGQLAALLKSATVKEVKLDFGETRVSRLVLGDLADPNVKKQLPDGYLKDLEKVRTPVDGYILITGVVTSSGMKYTFTCDDTEQLEAKAPEISELIKAEFNLNVSNRTEATWEIPETDVLAIGITPVCGEIARLRPDEVAKSRALNVENALLKLKTVDLQRLLDRSQ
jgi:hypothetical protein